MHGYLPYRREIERISNRRELTDTPVDNTMGDGPHLSVLIDSVIYLDGQVELHLVNRDRYILRDVITARTEAGELQWKLYDLALSAGLDPDRIYRYPADIRNAVGKLVDIVIQDGKVAFYGRPSEGRGEGSSSPTPSDGEGSPTY